MNILKLSILSLIISLLIFNINCSDDIKKLYECLEKFDEVDFFILEYQDLNKVDIQNFHDIIQKIRQLTSYITRCMFIDNFKYSGAILREKLLNKRREIENKYVELTQGK